MGHRQKNHVDRIRLLPALVLAVAMVVSLPTCLADQPDAEAPLPLMSRWALEIDRTNVLPEYPRPQMVREGWTNLNGEWDCVITPIESPEPSAYEGKILVPFPVESPLSGTTKKRVTPDDAIWYRRSFSTAIPQGGERLLMHFGAVDWKATVWVNGKLIGTHQGGYDPFQFDITDALVDQESQTMVVRVTDPTNKGFQAYGKQSLEPGMIVYTAVSGIWQTVWLEPVPATYVSSLRLTPHVESGEIEVTANIVGPEADSVIVRARVPREKGKAIRATGVGNKSFRIVLPNAHLWSPDDPHLYDLEIDIAVRSSGTRPEVVDRVASYFGMRSVKLSVDEDGFSRISLNGEEVFNFGPLDQGWWPGGLYTAPSDEALRYDIEVTKRYGFNMCRKHVKVEPARWYHWCDKLGLLVWQDMPNSNRAIVGKDPDLDRSKESEASFRREIKAMMDGLHNSPSIIVWVPFNEGWGQFKTNEIINWVKQYDPTRLVDGPSGTTDRGVGDLYDVHRYPGPGEFGTYAGRASVLGEFGGLGLEVENHTVKTALNWGYSTYDSKEILLKGYRQLIDNLWPLKQEGLVAAIYVQTTDVEGEVNGLMTYDRAVLKIDPEQVRECNQRMYAASPTVTTIVPNSKDPESPGEKWQFTTTPPTSSNWKDPDYDDSSWSSGRAGFGTPNTPGAVVRTEWDTRDIWLRRKVRFTESDIGRNLYFTVHHDEETAIYLDGQEIAFLDGHTYDYTIISLSDQARSAIHAGESTLAVHCHQEQGGQYIDLGFITVETDETTAEHSLPFADASSSFLSVQGKEEKESDALLMKQP